MNNLFFWISIALIFVLIETRQEIDKAKSLVSSSMSVAHDIAWTLKSVAKQMPDTYCPAIDTYINTNKATRCIVLDNIARAENLSSASETFLTK